MALNLFEKILMISSCGRPAKRGAMLLTSRGISPRSSSSSPTTRLGLPAGMTAAIRASDSRRMQLISSCIFSTSFSATNALDSAILASASAAFASASAFFFCRAKI